MCVYVSFSLSPIIISALYLQCLKALTRLLAFVISTANSKCVFFIKSLTRCSPEKKKNPPYRSGGQRFTNERKTGDFSSPLDTTRDHFHGSLDSKEHLALDDKKRNKKTKPACVVIRSGVWPFGLRTRLAILFPSSEWSAR